MLSNIQENIEKRQYERSIEKRSIKKSKIEIKKTWIQLQRIPKLS